MKLMLIVMAGVCLSLVFSPACAPAPAPEPEAAVEPRVDLKAEEAAILEVMDKLEAAKEAQDPAAMVDLNDEIFEYSYEGKIKGREALINYLSASFEAAKGLGQMQKETIGIVFVTSDVAIYKGREEYTGLVDEEGKARPPIKRFIARVVVKREGRWLIAASFDKPIVEAPAT